MKKDDQGVVRVATQHQSAASMAVLYSGAMFGRWSSHAPTLHPHEERLLAAFCPDKSISILNIGCGPGRETLALYDQGYTRVAGIDCTESLIALAQERSKERNLALDFRLAHAGAIPFPDATFDLVTMFENVYGHITPRAARLTALSETLRVLKPGGLVFLESLSIRNDWLAFLLVNALAGLYLVYNPWHMEPRDKLLRDATQTKAPPAELARSHWFSPKEVDRELESVGFHVVLSSNVQGVMECPTSHASKYFRQGRLLHVAARNR